MAQELKVIADFYDFTLWPEQQHRVPVGPAPSEGARGRPTQNHMVHGSCEGGLESPGPVPVLASEGILEAGQIYAVQPGGASRQRADGPTRLFCEGMGETAA